MGARRPLGTELESAGQIGLDLDTPPKAPLDLTVRVQDLEPGERFLLESCGVEGRALARGPSSMLVSIRGHDDRWTEARWSLGTQVRRLHA